MAQWRSEHLPVLLVGSAIGIAALIQITSANSPPPRQNAYATQQACEQDYRTDQCARTATSGGHFMYFGPSYYGRSASDGDPGPGRTALASSDGRSTAASSVGEASRGGFGSTGRSGRGYSG